VAVIAVGKPMLREKAFEIKAEEQTCIVLFWIVNSERPPLQQMLACVI